MTKADEIIQVVERMQRQERPVEEIRKAVDEIIFNWNREMMVALRLGKMMEKVTA